jgi:signal peptidase I
MNETSGNQHFVMGDDLEAIECYTLSLAYADNDELMAYAHANRSAALYRKQLYKECLIDIDAALNHGYPKEKQKNLKKRGDKAIIEIKKLLQIDSEDTNTRGVMDKLCPNDDAEEFATKSKNAEYIGNETAIEENTPKKQDTITKEDYLYYAAKVLPQKPRYLQNDNFSKLMYGPNKEVPAVSNGLAVSFSERYGRHYIATQEFKPGDIVSIEDPYVHVIYEERSEINFCCIYLSFADSKICNFVFVTGIIRIVTIVYPEATI